MQNPFRKPTLTIERHEVLDLDIPHIEGHMTLFNLLFRPSLTNNLVKQFNVLIRKIDARLEEEHIREIVRDELAKQAAQ